MSRTLQIPATVINDDITSDCEQQRLERALRIKRVAGLIHLDQYFLADILNLAPIQDARPDEIREPRANLVNECSKRLLIAGLSGDHELHQSAAARTLLGPEHI